MCACPHISQIFPLDRTWIGYEIVPQYRNSTLICLNNKTIMTIVRKIEKGVWRAKACLETEDKVIF